MEASVRRTVAEFTPDVLFAAWAYPDGWAAVELGRRLGLPVVVEIHGSDVLIQSKIPGCRKGVAQALSRADAVIAVSRDLATKAIALGAEPARVRTVYHGIDPDIFHPGHRSESRDRIGIPRDEKMLLFIGNLLPVKGLDILLDALSRLKLSGQSFRCHLIGQGSLMPELQHQVAQLGLDERVNFVGPLPQDQLGDWLRAANLFVLPSRSEGVPSVLLEASACGIPYVASRVGGIPEIADFGNGRLVPPEDADALAGAIAEALSETSSDFGRRFSRTFDDSAAEMRQVLVSAVESHRRGRVTDDRERSGLLEPLNAQSGL